MDVGCNDITPSSQRFSWDDLNTDNNRHDDENNVTDLMVDNKKDSVQVDTDVVEMDGDAESSQNGAAHEDHDHSPNDKNEELEEVVQDEGKMEVEDDQSSDTKDDDRFDDVDNLSSDEGDDAGSSTS
jgi:hypothetical protein